MATASEVSQRFDKGLEQKRQLIQDTLESAKTAAGRLQNDWPDDGFASSVAPGLAFSWMYHFTSSGEDIFFASDGTLWAGRLIEDEAHYLSPVEFQIDNITLEQVQGLKKALDAK